VANATARKSKRLKEDKMKNQTGYGASIIVSGKALEEHPFGGSTYIEAAPGQEFAVHVEGPPRSKFLAVISIDGLNILDGNSATVTGPGYVVWVSQNIRAWKLPGNRDGAQFVFTPQHHSYAAESGRPENTGVISIVLFAPKLRAHDFQHFDFDERRAPLKFGAESFLKGGGMGTEFGRRVNFQTTQVKFERGEEVARFTFRYDHPDALQIAGIIQAKNPLGYEVDAWPEDTKAAAAAGCVAPAGWTGGQKED